MKTFEVKLVLVFEDGYEVDEVRECLEETLVSTDELAVDSIGVVEKREVALSTAQQRFKLMSYKEQRAELARMIADDGMHHSNVCELWKAFGAIILATEEEKIDQEIMDGTAEKV